jgi:hypothetical protein
MTERKPPEVTFGSWVDQQIDEAAKRGAFDNLPGAGKPLPNRGEAAGDAWLREYLRREGVSAEELLPTPLKLRKEIGRLADSVQVFALSRRYAKSWRGLTGGSSSGARSRWARPFSCRWSTRKQWSASGGKDSR